MFRAFLWEEAYMRHLKLPLGMSDFEEIRQNGYYYIDKSGLISDLLVRKAAKVTLITRPRRWKDAGDEYAGSLF